MESIYLCPPGRVLPIYRRKGKYETELIMHSGCIYYIHLKQYIYPCRRA